MSKHDDEHDDGPTTAAGMLMELAQMFVVEPCRNFKSTFTGESLGQKEKGGGYDPD